MLLHECGHHKDWGISKVAVNSESKSWKLSPLGAELVGIIKSIDDINAELWALRWDRWARDESRSDLVVNKLSVLKYWNSNS